MADVLLTDIDGTLVDSNTLHAEAWRRSFEHFGIHIGMDEAWRQIGKGGDQLIPVFVPAADRKRLEKPLKEFLKAGGAAKCLVLRLSELAVTHARPALPALVTVGI